MKRLLVAVFALFVFAVPSCAQTPTGAEARSQVHALTTTDRGTFCSSVTIAPGVVLTAAHCTQIANPSVDGSAATGAVYQRGDDRLDLALIAFPRSVAQCPCVRLADSEARVDEPVYLIGYPHGIAQVVTLGASQGVQDNANLPFGRRLVATAPVMGGNSGGGVFVYRDGEYQLVGILVEGQGHLSFAIPLADIVPFLERPAS